MWQLFHIIAVCKQEVSTICWAGKHIARQNDNLPTIYNHYLADTVHHKRQLFWACAEYRLPNSWNNCHIAMPDWTYTRRTIFYYMSKWRYLVLYHKTSLPRLHHNGFWCKFRWHVGRPDKDHDRSGGRHCWSDYHSAYLHDLLYLVQGKEKEERRERNDLRFPAGSRKVSWQACHNW